MSRAHCDGTRLHRHINVTTVQQFAKLLDVTERAVCNTLEETN